MICVGIFGYGKMGKEIYNLINGSMSVNKIEIYHENGDIDDFIDKTDLILDFSINSATEFLADKLVQRSKVPKALLVGTTNLSGPTKEKLSQISKRTAIMAASNVTIGAFLLKKISASLAKSLGSEYDIDIIETHHKEKIDAPSGTAKDVALAIQSAITQGKFEIKTPRDALDPRSAGEIRITSIRAGRNAGIHEVLFSGEFDSFSIIHRMENRKLLAKAAINAGLWLTCQKNGLYTIDDMFLL
ncbi:MAG: 4-hydroxy-tetrahydrodipicolinate reductase [Rickettsiaceae bacterium]|nr:4-hydroxy-tetrahydrodipicolinate reductase [Rickettsiaceae bacterium]